MAATHPKGHFLMNTVFATSAFLIAAATSQQSAAAAAFEVEILPILTQHCNTCHSTEKEKGDLDLERFTSAAEVKKHITVWEQVLEQLGNGEMPPKNKPPLAPEEKERLTEWVRATLDEVALASAGDPGPVVLRRLSNAEYTYTLRDLTGVESLDPAHEFPVDGAAGEGFTNAGAGLVMSPSLVTKYLDAAKEIANHTVLLADGIRFSASTSRSDWTSESLAAIRSFYSRFTLPGGGSSVNLQGIKFDTADGGVLPLEKYLTATLSERAALAAGTRTLEEAAASAGLNAKYLTTLWRALNAPSPSPFLDPIRAQWRAAAVGEAPALAAMIHTWQQALWHFAQVGHIGKKDGPTAWQMPVDPFAESREIRLKIPPSPENGVVRFYLSTTDAGDGNGHDAAIWQNARFTAPGRADIPLKDLGATLAGLEEHRAKLVAGTARCLAAAAGMVGSITPAVIASASAEHGVEPLILETWLRCLGLGAGEPAVDSLLTQKLESAGNYPFIQGWTGADALSVMANSSGESVNIPGTVKSHGIVVHPAPSRRAAIGWRSPVMASLRIEGAVRDAHLACGNGVTWALQLRRGSTRRQLANGIAETAEGVKFGPLENILLRPGDLVVLTVGPRDGSHVCDLTAVDLKLSDAEHSWDLSADVSPDIVAGNPHADSHGKAAVWHFFSESDTGPDLQAVMPPGSLLARWQDSSDPAEKASLAEALQNLLTNGPDGLGLALDSPDAVVHRQLTALNGSLLLPALQGTVRTAPPSAAAPDAWQWGADPAVAAFDPRPEFSNNLSVRAPSVVEVRISEEIARDYEFTTTATLDREAGAEGSVQMQALVAKPSGHTVLTAGAAHEQGGKTTWSDGALPVISDSPILVCEGSAARQRLHDAGEEFRHLFPAALCYTKIVPVDEVVTLTLYYREDTELRRLLLDDQQAAELDRLWAELHYISQDALKLVDAFEQLWQFATQDADPAAFTAMREPIQQKYGAFKQYQTATQPAHLEAVLKFAENAWRRPLPEKERGQLRALYAKLRSEEIPHEEAIQLTLARILVAPAFLYRGEQAPAGVAAAPVNDHELAARLSYFLWSSAPDAELATLAAAGTLHQPEVLTAQARRMVRDPKVRRLATEFGCQWLNVRDLESLDEKSERHFPAFVSLRADMQEETVRFFIDLFQEDRPVLSLLDSDYTFVNGPLAAFYGLNVAGTDWQRVGGLRAKGRGGILGFSSTLAKQSGASRTSPILRGNWLSEVVLGERLPRPPKGIPVLPEEPLAGLTERQLIERHSSDPICTKCHQRIDPFGFALEGFDAIGHLRSQDAAGLPINTATTLPDGTSISGLDGLRAYLIEKRGHDFLRQFSRKLLGYALGRPVQLSDRPLIEETATRLQSGGGTASAAIDSIILSPQFRQIRGRDVITRN